MRTSLNIPTGIVGDDTAFRRAGRWRDGNNVRFWLGQPQVIGGWERLTTDLLSGVCRNALPWTDNDSARNVALGTHSHLYVFRDGVADITPTLGRPSVTLLDDALSKPFTVSDGSATVTVHHNGHGLDTGDQVVISGAEAVGRITPSGTYAVTVVDDDSYTITHGSNADLAETLGNDPLAVTNGSAVVTVTDTAHGLPDGLEVTISGATAVGGITPNGTFPIEVIDADSYKFTFTVDEVPTNANADASGGGAAVVVTVPATGGGSAVVVAPQNPFQVGSVDGTGGAGYGTGTYSTGTFSSPSTEDFYPRSWSFGALGQWLVANPRGGPAYAWKNDTATPAAPIPNSPRNIICALIGPHDEVFAFGCNEEISGRFNPLCIRHSDLRDALGPRHEIWHSATDTNAAEYVLPGGGWIVGAKLIGRYILVWTNHSLFVGQYMGQENQIWRFDRVGQNCGLIGPNAAVVVGATAYWLGPDLQFRGFNLGGAPFIIPCPIRKDMADNLATVQGDKVVASSCSPYNEIRFDYPDARDGTGVENSRYVAASLDVLASSPDHAWYRGVMARSAMVDAGPSSFPIGASPDGKVFLHERGNSADGGPISWFIRSADQFLDENYRILLRGLWPDFAVQRGAVELTVRAREKPQGMERTEGPHTLAVGQEKQDLRLGGRLFSFEFSGNVGPTEMRLGRISIDIARMGGR